jgi:septal ring factor EnvC (AmiA/AmiB activator)
MTVAINRFRFLAAGSVVGVCIVSFGVGAQTGEERALEAVRGQIQSIERRLAQETSERDALNADLRTAELAIAAVNGYLARIRDRLREQLARQRTLAAQ